MNNLKKILSLCVASVAMISLFAACNKKADEATDTTEPAVTDDMLTEEDITIEEDALETDEVATETEDDASAETSGTSEATEESK